MKRFISRLSIATTFAVASILSICLDADADILLKVIGTSCVPDNESIQSDRYFTGASGVSFKDNKTGVIKLFCSLQPQDGSTSNNLSNVQSMVTDPDGAGNLHRVIVKIVELDVNDDVTRVVSTLDSNNQSQVVFRKGSFLRNLTGIEASGGLFFLRAELYRNSTNGTPRFHGAFTSSQVQQDENR